MIQSLLNKKLEKWQSQLMDLTRRNKLLSFRDTSKSVKIPTSLQKLYKDLLNTKSVPVHQYFDFRNNVADGQIPSINMQHEPEIPVYLDKYIEEFLIKIIRNHGLAVITDSERLRNQLNKRFENYPNIVNIIVRLATEGLVDKLIRVEKEIDVEDVYQWAKQINNKFSDPLHLTFRIIKCCVNVLGKELLEGNSSRTAKEIEKKVQEEIESLEKTLTNIRREKQNVLKEQGVNVLYIAFGFLKWYESEKKQEVWKSPLLLMPIELKKERGEQVHSISCLEEDLILNPVLVQKLKVTFNLYLPDLSERGLLEADASIVDIIRFYKETIKNRPTWEIEESAYLGLFSFSKISMYKEFETYSPLYSEHPIVRQIGGEEVDSKDIIEIMSLQTHDEMEDLENSYQILDADSSQQNAILAAKKGISFIMQGPPGTGKSQTITNIIAELLGAGKTVLFVSEKAAALEVVKKRLEEKSIGDFCLELHSNKTNKKAVIEELGRVLRLSKNKRVTEIPYATYNDIKGTLNSYVVELYETRHPLNISLYEAYGKISSFSNIQNITFLISGANKYSVDKLEQVKVFLNHLNSSKSLFTNQQYIRLWGDHQLKELTSELEKDISCNFSTLEKQLSEIINGLDKVAYVASFGEKITPLQLRKVFELHTHLKNKPYLVENWFYGDYSKVYSEVEQKANDYKMSKDTVLKSYHSSVFMLDINQLKKGLLYKYEDMLRRYKLQVRELGDIAYQNDELLNIVQKINSSVKELLSISHFAGDKLGIFEPNPDLKNLEFIAKFLGQLKEVKFPATIHWFQLERRKYLLEQYQAASEINQALSKEIAELTKVYDETIIDAELREVNERFKVMYPQYFRNVEALEETLETDNSTLAVVNRMIFCFQHLRDFEHEFNRSLGIKNFPFTINKIKFLIELYKEILRIKCEPTENWFNMSNRRKLERDLGAAKHIIENYKDKKTKLTMDYQASILTIEIQSIEKRFSEYLQYFNSIACLDYSWNADETVMQNVKQAIKVILELKEFEKEANERFGMGRLPLTLKKLRTLSQINENMQQMKMWPTEHWFNPLERSKLNNYVNAGKEETASYRNKLTDLSEKYDMKVLQLDIKGMQKRFMEDYDPLSSIFRKQYRKDVKALKIYQKKEMRTRFSDYVRHLKLMGDIKESKDWLSQEVVKERLGPDYQDEHTGWSELETSIKAIVDICGLVASYGGNSQHIQDLYSGLFEEGTVLEVFNQSIHSGQSNLLKAMETLEGIMEDVSKYIKVGSLTEDTDLLQLVQWLYDFVDITNRYMNDIAVFKKHGAIGKKYGDYLSDIALIKELQRYQLLMNEERTSLAQLLGNGYQEVDTDWCILEDSIQAAFRICELLSEENISIVGVGEEILLHKKEPILYPLTVLQDSISDIEENLKSLQNKLKLPLISEKGNLIPLLHWLKDFIVMAEQYKNDKIYLHQHSKVNRTYSQVILDMDLINRIKARKETIEQEECTWKEVLGTGFQGVLTDWELLKQSIQLVFKLSDTLQEKDISIHLLCEFLCQRSPQPFEIAEKEIHLVRMLNKLRVNIGLFDNYVLQLNGSFDKTNLIMIHEWSTKITNVIVDWLNIRKNVMQYSSLDTTCTFSGLLEIIHHVQQVQEIKQFIERNNSFYNTAFGELYNGLNTDWKVVVHAIKWVETLKSYFKDGLSEKFIHSITNDSNDYEFLMSELDKIKLVWTRSKKDREFLGYVFPINKPLFIGEQFNNAPIETIINQLHEWANNIPELKRLFELQELLKKAESLKVQSFVVKLLENDTSLYHQHSYVDLFLKQLYIQFVDNIHKQIPYMANFRREYHESMIKNFCLLDSNYINSNQNRLYTMLKKRKTNFISSEKAVSERQILERELQKSRSHKPIRLLFSEIPNLVQQLKPCMMMSPLSVSELIDVRSMQFDVVIFDEASQVRSEDAIGSIIRGKQLIVVGDSKQLPPSRFFNSAGHSEDSTDDETDEIYESILDECSMFLSQKPLQWHYRSKHESLIAFSNHYIYDSNLVTFPSAYYDKRNGVSLVYVEDGIYDRGKSNKNKREAEKVVELIFEHAHLSPERSLGVIAFNTHQEEAIRDEFERQFKKNSQYSEFFDEEKEEAFFIKNLENVQGDERDTILFSIGFGKALDGSMYYNFGPLTQEGGERRLNVAITRAKYEVKVITSILDTDLEDRKLKKKGPELLKKYLSYARSQGNLSRVTKNQEINTQDAILSTLEQDIQKTLEEKGFKVIGKLGDSEFKVDLAIVDPENRDKILLGIMTDGEIYKLGATVRDRERLRPNILKNLGWKVYRVFAPEWQRNKSEEVDKIIRYLKEDTNK